MGGRHFCSHTVLFPFELLMWERFVLAGVSDAGFVCQSYLNTVLPINSTSTRLSCRLLPRVLLSLSRDLWT